MTRRTGILGGTFDPIHRGHLAAAAAARHALHLDRVLFVPSSSPPHRPAPPQASAFHRFAMVSLAVSGRPEYEASDIELQRGGLSYTARTLDHLASEGSAPSSLFFITGADAFAEIATWFDYPRLLERAHFVVVSRQGTGLRSLQDTLPALASHMEDASAIDLATLDRRPLPSILLVAASTPDVSSTRIRQVLEQGEGVADALPSAVADHIRRHRLYQSDSLPEPTPVAGRAQERS